MLIGAGARRAITSSLAFRIAMMIGCLCCHYLILCPPLHALTLEEARERCRETVGRPFVL